MSAATPREPETPQTEAALGPDEPTTQAGRELLAAMFASVLAPEIAKLIGADGRQQLVALVSVDLLQKDIPIIERDAAAAPGAALDAERLREAIDAGIVAVDGEPWEYWDTVRLARFVVQRLGAAPDPPSVLPPATPIEGLDIGSLYDLLSPAAAAELDAVLRAGARTRRAGYAAAATIPLGGATPDPLAGGKPE